MEVELSVTVGRTMGMYVLWSEVHGAESYLARTSTDQNCSSSVGNYCLITTLSCGQNLTVTVTAENQAGPGVPSQSEPFVPCTYHTKPQLEDTLLELYYMLCEE